MFREMRLKKQQLSEAETAEMLRCCTSGVLALAGDDDYPYAVPLSFAFADGKLYFHFAKSGHKLDAMKRNAKASFCVIAADTVVPATFTTHYRSAIAFGRIRLHADDGEKKRALEFLAKKYSPAHLDRVQAEIEREWKNVCTAELTIEHMTGKAASELIE